MSKKISYIGTKIINGTPMNKYEFHMNVKGQDCKEDNEDGYMVEYPDGYKSWSSKKTFEEAYRPINDDEKALFCDFIQRLRLIRSFNFG